MMQGEATRAGPAPEQGKPGAVGDADAAELVFVPLGGAGEIGMNLNLYGYGPAERRRWLMIDLGVTFGGDGVPGIDVVMPDPAFIAERRDRLEAIVLTHAHEDHLGAVAHLWPRLRCPVWGTDFALTVLRSKLIEAGLEDVVPVHRLPSEGPLTLGPFALTFFGLTHSIPEMQAVAIRTPAGLIVHSGDWKFDPEPVVGAASDEAGLARLGDDGVLALMCDSTNVFEHGTSGSEGGLLDALIRLVADCPARVAVACFSSNIARLHTIGMAARHTGRSVVLAGASLARNYRAARACGYLDDLPAFLDAREARDLPRDKTLMICTGTQGEQGAALSRLAFGIHPALALDEGDVVLISARVIPGNERGIARMHNQFLRRGIRCVTGRETGIHVSGHPARDELTRMHALVRPRVLVPVHGELRHMHAHAALGRGNGIDQALVAENGTMVRLFPLPAAVMGQVPSGRLSLEGRRPVPLGGPLVRGRTKAVYEGAAFVTVAVCAGAGAQERGGCGIQLDTVGLLEDGEDEIGEVVVAAAANAVEGLSRASYTDDENVRETVRLAVRRAFRHILDKRPVTHVHVVRTGEPR
jgi:ribonuclease J